MSACTLFFILLATAHAVTEPTLYNYPGTECTGTDRTEVSSTPAAISAIFQADYPYCCDGSMKAGSMTSGDDWVTQFDSETICMHKASVGTYLFTCEGVSGCDVAGSTPGSTGSAPCFGRQTTHALRPDGEPVLMSALEAGELVKDGPSTVARVIVVQHANTDDRASNLLTLEHSGGTLEVTADHVIMIDGSFAPARAATPGSSLSSVLGEHTVLRISSASGAIINPLTTSGKILTQGGILASTYPEWIAEYMLSSRVFPLPLSFSNALSYLLPKTAQAYYDAVVEPVVTAHHPLHLKAALPAPLLPAAVLLGDLLISAGFVAFILACPVAIASVAVGALWASRK